MRNLLVMPLVVAYGVSGLLSAAALGQGATAVPAGPVEVSPEARAVLKMLEERKTTLKDFTGKMDYSVETRIGDISGKRGTVEFINDATKGPIFSADFTVNTEEGKVKQLYHVQFLFDGTFFLIKDFGKNNDVKQYVKTRVLPEGSKPGDAASLTGAVTLPIGLNTEDVIRTFEVTLLPAKEANQAVLKIVPREKAKYDYESLEVTVDKSAGMQVPIKLAQTAKSGDVTTLTLTELKINSGEAKAPDMNIPAGWTDRGGG